MPCFGGIYTTAAVIDGAENGRKVFLGGYFERAAACVQRPAGPAQPTARGPARGTGLSFFGISVYYLYLTNTQP